MSSLSFLILWSLTAWRTQAATAFIDPPSNRPAGQVVLQKVPVDDGDDDADDDGPDKTLVSKSADIKPGGPWLGLQFGPVSKAVGSQLRIDANTGQMVLNVVEGSPADLAGLQQYDVIVDIDGQAASSKIDDFMSVVHGFEPGEAHTLTVVRAGQRVSAQVTVATRPEEIGPSKYKVDDEEWSQNRVFGRGGMLQKDDKGNWVFRGFNMPDLPDIWKSIPGPDDPTFNLALPFGGHGSKNRMFIHKDKGQSTRIQTDDDGKITVTKTVNENGKETTTTKTYANRQELEASDPEVAKMFTESPSGLRFHWGDDKGFRFQLEGDARAKVEEAMKNAKEALKNAEGAMKQSDDVIQRMHEQLAPKGDGKAKAFVSRKARTSFDVQPDGRIRVTTRQGDEELTTTYENADSLKQARPELYRKFERLQEKSSAKLQD